MNENAQQLSILSLAVSGILSQNLSASEINTLGLFLSVVGDILQLNYWQISQPQNNDKRGFL
ncbi:MAG: hypothetical protein R3Y09_05880 [Clostridia bacterium]